MELPETHRVAFFVPADKKLVKHHHFFEVKPTAFWRPLWLAPLAALLAFGLCPEPVRAGAANADAGISAPDATAATVSVSGNDASLQAEAGGFRAVSYEPVRLAPVPAPYEPPDPRPAKIFQHDPGQFLPDPPVALAEARDQ